MDVDMIDYIVDLFYDHMRFNQGRKAAHEVLLGLQNDPAMVFRLREILDNSNCLNTKLFALQVLEGVIKYRWNGFTVAEKDGISFYVWNVIQRLLHDKASFQEEKLYVNKLNIIFVQILKRDLSERGQDFILSYLSFVSKLEASDIVCENFMVILRLLIEELFEFSNEEMTREIAKLSNLLIRESVLIYECCFRVLSMSEETELMCATLSTLHSILKCIPSVNFFKFSLLDLLIDKFPRKPCSNLVLQCLIEVVGLDFPKVGIVQLMHNQFLNELQCHIDVLETTGEAKTALITGLEYLIKISYVKDTEVRKCCLHYWKSFVLELLEAHLNLDDSIEASDMSVFEVNPLDVIDGIVSQIKPSKELYAEIMPKLRMLMVSCMVKPEDVLLVEDKNQNINHEAMMDSDALVQDKIRETLIFLSHLYPEDTEKEMLNLLKEHINGQNLDLNFFSKLCWAIGSISGSMMKEQEIVLLASVIEGLLSCLSCTNYKHHKAVIITNFMYVVGQYPRLLSGQWALLKVVVNKLLEFMHETHPKIRDMACYTILKIVRECKQDFVIVQEGEKKPFVSELLSQLPDLSEGFEPHQIYTLFESFGHMIQAEYNPQKREEYLKILMKLPNQQWYEIIMQLREIPCFPKDEDTMRKLVNILQTNRSVASSLGMGTKYQMSLMFEDMLYIVRFARGCSSGSETSHMELLRTGSVRTEILKLIGTCFDKAECQREIAEEFLHPVIHLVVEEFNKSQLDSLDSELFLLCALIVKTYKDAVTNDVHMILDVFFSCTLELKISTFDNYHEQCLKFFVLLRAIATHCLSALITPKIQKLFMDLVKWAVGHTERNIAESGLNLLLEMLKKFQDSELRNQFYKDYFLSILELIFGVLMDTFHKPGFKLHVMVLHHLFCLAGEDGLLNKAEPLWYVSKYPFRSSNEIFVRKYVTELIAPFCIKVNTTANDYVNALFSSRDRGDAFRCSVRNFLQQSDKFSEYDADLFPELEEHDAAERERMLRLISAIYNRTMRE
ncbi:protein EXPORTIN 1A-like isoform X2 [Humulus lupulus]|uniref:protein EXPORTIN 1A-like isoform X2 n=1 Tax=Humulus lupulus TaxID=3486 RepID=UPI002B411E6A|nr:protein EXPORTIN 1A-like isoform X2 [Humulus lupulus]